MERLLELPRLAPFTESPLPCGIKPVTRAVPDKDAEEPNDDETAADPHLAELSLPSGFAAVRAERQGEEAVAIGLAQDYDPVGEISRGAYAGRPGAGGSTRGCGSKRPMWSSQPRICICCTGTR